MGSGPGTRVPVHPSVITIRPDGAWTRLTASAGIADASASTHPASTVSHAQSLVRSGPYLRPRVLAVAQSSSLGGAEYALLRIARRLPAHGFEVVLTTPGPGPLADAARRDGIAVHRLAPGGLARGRWPRAVASWPRALALLRRLRPDLVYLNGTIAQRLAPGFPGATLVPHLHDLLEVTPRPWRSRWFWRRTPVVLCASRAMADAAAAAGAPPERLRTVYTPIEAPEPVPRPVWAAGGPVIGFVGRLERAKGVLDLIAALPAVLERRPDLRAVLVGDRGGDRGHSAQLEREAGRLGDRVLLAGRIEEAARLMPWFDVLAVPSRGEAFGTVAAEALAAGTPVVATHSGGMAEYVVPGRNGALVPPGDPPALARALLSVLEDAPRMAAAARTSAEPFAADRVAAAVAEALREALERRPGAVA